MKPTVVPVALTYHGLLYEPHCYPDVKDPSPVFDGERWHLFGTGCGVPSGAEVLHSTAPVLSGPWREEPSPTLLGVDASRAWCAPGVAAEGPRLHLFLQHDFNVLGGDIDHLVSDDGGACFVRAGTALRSSARLGEAGVYDPDVAEVRWAALPHLRGDVSGRPARPLPGPQPLRLVGGTVGPPRLHPRPRQGPLPQPGGH